MEQLEERERFTLLRRRAGLRQSDVALAAGVSRAYVSLYESGAVVPPDKTVAAFWEALDSLSLGLGGPAAEAVA